MTCTHDALDLVPCADCGRREQLELPLPDTRPKLCNARNGGEHQYMWHCTRPLGHEGDCEP